MPHPATDPALQHVLWAAMQPLPGPGEVPLLARSTAIVKPERIIPGPMLVTPLAKRSVERMPEIDQPAWANRVARSSPPHRVRR